MDDQDVFYMMAFGELSTCRSVPSPIPWTAIREYAREHGLDWYTIGVFHRVVREMDVAYLKWVADQTRPPKNVRRQTRRERTKTRGS